MDQNEFAAQDFGFLAPQDGDLDYIPGRWVFLTEDGVSQAFLTKFDALIGHLDWARRAKIRGIDPGGTIIQLAALDIS